MPRWLAGKTSRNVSATATTPNRSLVCVHVLARARPLSKRNGVGRFCHLNRRACRARVLVQLHRCARRTVTTPKAVAAGKRARAKGVRWEREVNRALRVLFPLRKIWRGDQSGRGSSKEYCDNEGTSYWIESKHWKKVNIDKAIAQARAKQAECEDERPIVVIAKSDNCEPFVSMPLEDWFDLVDERNELRSASSWVKRRDWKHALKKGKE